MNSNLAMSCFIVRELTRRIIGHKSRGKINPRITTKPQGVIRAYEARFSSAELLFSSSFSSHGAARDTLGKDFLDLLTLNRQLFRALKTMAARPASVANGVIHAVKHFVYNAVTVVIMPRDVAVNCFARVQSVHLNQNYIENPFLWHFLRMYTATVLYAFSEIIPSFNNRSRCQILYLSNGNITILVI